MPDLLLELRSEEIPARMQAKAREDLARLFAAELGKAGLSAAETLTYATPRRLALIARGLPDATAAVAEEVKGPRASAPPQALDGFLRKTGLTREQLTERDGVFFAISEKPGRPTAELLAEAIPAIVRGFPWPKAMRWGAASVSAESPRWVRPLHGVVALFGEAVVPVEVAGVASGAQTLGHRFHHPGAITIGSAADYVEKLRACHVLVDQAEREALIRERAAALAAGEGLELIPDEGLVAENAGLTEWPVPLLGRFDPAFLDVPPEVIQLTARVNQKYFVCRAPSAPLPPAGGVGGGPVDGGDTPSPDPSREREGGLANAFVCVANIAAADGGATIVEGNRKVLAARLADARFFYEQDLKVRLEDQAKKLDRIVFHEKLGTVADKVDRVAKLARWLVEEGIVGESPSRLREGLGVGASAAQAVDLTSPPPTPPASGRGELADLAERAARLAKADLVTGMVGEFPELQGVMGGYYAAAQGEDPQVAAAIRDHYKPVGQGDEVPTAPVTVAVSLADKLDTLVAFFGMREGPTGSRDPYALRRAAISIIRLIENNGLRLGLGAVLREGTTNLERNALTTAYERVIGKGVLVDDRNWHYRVTDGFVELFVADTLAFRIEAAKVVDAFAGVDLDFDARSSLLDFFADRLKVQQREAGVRHDLIDAVFALGGEDDLVRLLARVRALQQFVGTADGANLITGYRRAANILKKEGWGEGDTFRHPGFEPGSRFVSAAEDGSGTPGQARGDEHSSSSFPLSYTPEPAEKALADALDAAAPRAAAAVAAEDFAGAMAALASLRAPIDAFFDSVTVNDLDPVRRQARLALLGRMRDAVHQVADFSRIEG